MWTPELAPDQPAYQALADAIAQAISSGVLAPGDRLPPQRELADALGVNLGTVSRGYQLACQRGLTQGEVGRGTFVRSDRGGMSAFQQTATERRLIDLSMNTPSPVHDPNLSQLLGELAREDCQHLLRYQVPGGNAAQLEAGAEWLRRLGLETSPDELFVCGGAQHAISLCFMALAERGATVLCEELTYPGAAAAARSLGLQVHAVPLDGQGMQPDALERALRSTRAKLIYSLPTLHNPTTASLSKKRRAQLAEIVERHQAWLIEDDILGGLLPKPPTPVASLIPERSFFIGSVSKLIAGGLRVAYVRPPQSWRQALTGSLQANAWMTSPLTCELARRLILSGDVQPILERRRTETIARNEVAREVFQGFKLHTADTYHGWLELPEPWSADAFTAELAQRGVLVRSATAFHLGRGAVPRAIRVSLSGAGSDSELRSGLERVRELLTAGAPGPAL
ncbi:MAG: PLP-dependent aminotransferase family protein [Polyangiaceae bacterium]|nr:PLP-dependent aminotransferase family protein [Polyangiaceae bacterium]